MTEKNSSKSKSDPNNSSLGAFSEPNPINEPKVEAESNSSNPDPTTIPLVNRFGAPVVRNKEGEISRLNDIFWAAYYSQTQVKIICEGLEQTFYNYDPDTGVFLPKSPEKIRVELNALVLEASRTWKGYFGLQSFRNTKDLAGAITQLRGLVEERDFFNNQDNLVHLANCTLRFDSKGNFSEEKFSPDHRARNRSPLSYDPRAECPEFKEKLLGHVPEEDRILIQKYYGQCLLGRNLIQRLMILDGVGKSSKSTLALVLNGIVGRDNCYQLRTQLLMERFEIGRMIGRTLLIGPDVKGNFLNHPSASQIKALIGDDPLSAELKKSNEVFTIYGAFNMFLTSNSRLYLHLEDDSGAWNRRLLIIRFETPYRGKKIFEIHKYLLEREGSGIINFCLEGLQMLFADYESQLGDIYLPASQQTRIDNLLAESDSLRIFVETKILRDDSQNKSGESFSLTTEEIIAEYFHDCIFVNKWSTPPREIVEKTLPELMLRFHSVSKSHDIDRLGSQKRGYHRVRFLESATADFNNR